MKMIRIVAMTGLLMFIGTSAHADPWVSGAGGAVVGGILGGVVAGKGGAAVGAVLGGVMGVGADAEQVQQAKQARMTADYADRADWERERRERVAAMKLQQSDQWGIGDSINSSDGVVPDVRSAAPTNAAERDLIVEMQKSIKRLGYEPGVIGTLNRQTVATIRMYQAQYDLLETGRPSPELLAHMRRHGG
jgi:hypothetical protein